MFATKGFIDSQLNITYSAHVGFVHFLYNEGGDTSGGGENANLGG